MVKVYSEEIAAFYDTKTKTMHLIKEPEVKNKKPPTFLERLMGKTGGFDKDENKTVIAHELTHALADQNFDIDAMQKAVKHDDDRDLALSALVEGEATLTMIGAQMNDWDGSVVREIPAADLDRVFSFLMPAHADGRRQEPARGPRDPLRDADLPLLPGHGLLRAADQRRRLGRSERGLQDTRRSRPSRSSTPRSTRPSPTRRWRSTSASSRSGKGWKELGRNVVGEMQLGVLLRRHGGKAAAAGWDGDRFAVFEGPEGRLGLVWLSTWDTENDALEFLTGYTKFQTTKLGKDVAQPEAFPDTIRRAINDAVYAVERRGCDVAVVEGFPPDLTEDLVDKAFKAKKTEITHEPIANVAKTTDESKPDGSK